jgi:hypothetical protein
MYMRCTSSEVRAGELSVTSSRERYSYNVHTKFIVLLNWQISNTKLMQVYIFDYSSQRTVIQ